jgi:hypothetical protein
LEQAKGASPPKVGGLGGAIFVRILISRKVFTTNICMLKTIEPYIFSVQILNKLIYALIRLLNHEISKFQLNQSGATVSLFKRHNPDPTAYGTSPCSRQSLLVEDGRGQSSKLV